MHDLETERLLFRDHEDADMEAYCEMESDPVYRAPQRVHPRGELERSFREGWLPPKPMGLLATIYKPEGRYIGRCGLYPCRSDDGEKLGFVWVRSGEGGGNRWHEYELRNPPRGFYECASAQ